VTNGGRLGRIVHRSFGRFHRDARLILVTSLVAGAAISLWWIDFNLYLRALGYETATIGLVSTLASLAGGLIAFPASAASDRFGRRAAFIAGLGGCLFAYQQQTISPPSFAVFTSLSLLAVTYVASVGRIAGAVVAGVMLSSTGLMVTAMDKAFNVGKYQLVVAGVLLTLTAIKQPDGIAANPPPPLVKLWERLRRGRRPAPEVGEAPARVSPVGR